MSNQNLFIYEFEELYKILSEIKKDINVDLDKAYKNQLSEINQRSNSLIFTRKKIPDVDNQIIFDKFPVSIFKLLEKINIEFLKKPKNYCLFKLMNHNVDITNVLIVGCGGAGLRAAIEAKISGLSVKVLGKRSKDDAHTVLAAGGINAAFGNLDKNDSWEYHFADTFNDYWQRYWYHKDGWSGNNFPGNLLHIRISILLSISFYFLTTYFLINERDKKMRAIGILGFVGILALIINALNLLPMFTQNFNPSKGDPMKTHLFSFLIM